MKSWRASVYNLDNVSKAGAPGSSQVLLWTRKYFGLWICVCIRVNPSPACVKLEPLKCSRHTVCVHILLNPQCSAAWLCIDAQGTWCHGCDVGVGVGAGSVAVVAQVKRWSDRHQPAAAGPGRLSQFMSLTPVYFPGELYSASDKT